MGCVQARPSAPSPSRGLHKMKLDHGYVPARGARGRGVPPRQSSRRSSAAARERSGEGGEGRRRARSAERGGNTGGDRKVEERAEPVVERRREVRNGDGEELVDGWPRWLAENVPREVLAGLVPRSADSYDKLDKVGQGTYSNVYKARDRETGKIVALKKVRFDTSEPESVKFMAREIMILQKLDHPNVIKLEGLATSRMQYSLYLVFDFMQSDLARVVSRPDGNLTEPQVKCYMHQLLAGLQHCHERGILHRDIKGSNLLIDKHGMLKIADFGLANYFNPNNRQPLTSRVVTLWYRAPELLLGTTDYGVGIDLWSAGCLLAEMFAGRPIMPGRTEVEQLHRIFKLCGSPSEDYWIKLKLSTSFRPPHPYKSSILEAFRDFPSSSMGLLATLLALDPSNRGSAASALNNEFFTTSPLACDLSGLPVVYKEETDDTMQPRERRRRKTSRRRSRTQKEGREVEDTLKPNGDSVTSKEEKTSVRKAYSQELGSSAGSTSSGMKPTMFSVSPSPSSIPEKSHSRKTASESHPSATSNIKNLPLPPSDEAADNDNMHRRRQSHHRSLEKRSSSASGFRRSEGKPKRYIAG